jgi:hypothetical protein
VLRRRRVGAPGRGAVRHASDVAERPHPLAPLDAQELVDAHPAALVERQTELGRERVCRHTGRPDDGVREHVRPVGEHGDAGLHGVEPRVHVDLHATPRQQPGGVVAEPGRDLRQDLFRRVDEHPALRLAAQHGVVAKGVADEVGQLAQRLDPGVAGADEDEGELLQPAAGGRRGRGGLELAEDVVTEMDRVGERLEGDGVLGQTRNGQRADDRARREDEVLVADPEELVLRAHLHAAAPGVVSGRVPHEQLGVTAHLA